MAGWKKKETTSLPTPQKILASTLISLLFILLATLYSFSPSLSAHIPISISLSLSPPWLELFSPKSNAPEEFICKASNYTTEIISTDPLVIYINDFVSEYEAEALIGIGEPELSPSLLHTSPSQSPHSSSTRRSSSGALPPSLSPVSCILARARHFLGPSLLKEYEDFGMPQMVRYKVGEEFELHRDWYSEPQVLQGRGRGMFFNRVASFFVYLDVVEGEDGDGDIGGETWFPRINLPELDSGVEEGKGGNKEGWKWRQHEEGGTAFRPLKGNAVFWINLFANGTGDERVVHAGLPLRGGVKTAMNIWPRRFYRGW